MAETRFVSRSQARERLADYLRVRAEAGEEHPQAHLAHEAGISRSAICQMLHGKLDVTPAIARAIGLQPVKGFLELE